jgi:hypothetical protein
MTPSARLALGLWIAFAVVVWNVSFDRQVKTAGRAFMHEQLARHTRGLPVTTINDGFRPRIRAAAVRSSAWSLLIAGTGVAATAWAARRTP